MKNIKIIIGIIILFLFSTTYAAINFWSKNIQYKDWFSIDFSKYNLNDFFEWWRWEENKYSKVFFVKKSFIDNYLISEKSLSDINIKYRLIQYKYTIEGCNYAFSTYNNEKINKNNCDSLLPSYSTKDIIVWDLNKEDKKAYFYYSIKNKLDNWPDNWKYMMIFINSKKFWSSSQLFSNYITIDWNFKWVRDTDLDWYIDNPFKIISFDKKDFRSVNIKIKNTARLVEDWNYINLDFWLNFEKEKINNLIQYTNKKLKRIINKNSNIAKKVENKLKRYNTNDLKFIYVHIIREKNIEKKLNWDSLKLDLIYYLQWQIALLLNKKWVNNIDTDSYYFKNHSTISLVWWKIKDIIYEWKSILKNKNYIINTRDLTRDIKEFNKNKIYLDNSNIFGNKIYLPINNKYKILIEENKDFKESNLFNFYISIPSYWFMLKKYNYENLLKKWFNEIECNFLKNNLECLSKNKIITPNYEWFLYNTYYNKIK